MILSLLALFFGGMTAWIGYALIWPPPSANPDAATPLLLLFPLAFLWLSVFVCRNLSRLTRHGAISADEGGVSLQIPVVPFRFAPYCVVRESHVAWSDVDLQFTPGPKARYFVSSSQPATEIPAAAFGLSHYQIDAAIRAAAEHYGFAALAIPPEWIVTGSSPAVLLTAGAIIAGVSGTIAVLRVEVVPEVATLMTFPFIFGTALIAMGAAPRRRVILDRRGIFVERGVFLDFVPAAAFQSMSAEFSDASWGAFKSGRLTATVDGKRVRIGFNQIFGFGFAIKDIRSALGI